MKPLILAVLKDVDEDIGEIMLSNSTVHSGVYEDGDTVGNHKLWELLNNPVDTILKWQELRDRAFDRSNQITKYGKATY